MKKKIILMICLLSISYTSNAFFWSPTEIDLYYNIEDWLEELEDKLLEFELNWWQQKKWILKEINVMAKYNEINECLDESKEIWIEKFKSIVEEENISELVNYFSDKCSSENKERGHLVERATIYMDLFKEYLRINKINSEDKTKKIYQVSSLWMYSDWILENSWFDLISDIDEIDRIIFSQVEEYEWEDSWDLEILFEDELHDAAEAWVENLDNEINNQLEDLFNWENDDNQNNNSNNNNSNNNNSNNNQNDNHNSTDPSNNYICINNEQTSWLSNDNINNLLDNINNPNWDWNLLNDNQNSWNENWWDWNNNNDLWDNNYLEELESEYVKVIDNSEFPCEDFFCIVIEFITNDNSNSSEEITIEYLIKRSNEHLAKFAWTSLIPAKHSTNQFQLWLEDLNLPDIFHIWIQIVKKPIPILNIEPEWKTDNSKYSWKNLLEEYYKLNWLNYKRRNSIVLLEWLEQNKQNINNSVWLTTERILHKDTEYKTLKTVKNNSETLTKIIWKKVALQSLKNFEEQFIELNKLISTINDYTVDLKSIIGEMEKIPITK